MDRPVFREALLNVGIRLDATGQFVCFATSHPLLMNMVKDHPFANDLRGQLKRIDGADVNDNKVMLFGTMSKKVVRIPVGPLLSND